jgi:hypothetical protein
MHTRCYNKNCKDFKDYGARGIKVCDAWHEYTHFRDYMLSLSNCPKNANDSGVYIDWQIDRIKNDQGYKPGNVRWATREQQANNKRTNRVLIVTTQKGRSRMTLAQSVDKYGKASYDTVWTRLSRGWPLNKAILTPETR